MRERGRESVKEMSTNPSMEIFVFLQLCRNAANAICTILCQAKPSAIILHTVYMYMYVAVVNSIL